MKNKKDPLVNYETKGTDSEEGKQSNMKLVRIFFQRRYELLDRASPVNETVTEQATSLHRERMTMHVPKYR